MLYASCYGIVAVRLILHICTIQKRLTETACLPGSQRSNRSPEMFGKKPGFGTAVRTEATTRGHCFIELEYWKTRPEIESIQGKAIRKLLCNSMIPATTVSPPAADEGSHWSRSRDQSGGIAFLDGGWHEMFTKAVAKKSARSCWPTALRTRGFASPQISSISVQGELLFTWPTPGPADRETKPASRRY